MGQVISIAERLKERQASTEAEKQVLSRGNSEFDKAINQLLCDRGVSTITAHDVLEICVGDMMPMTEYFKCPPQIQVFLNWIADNDRVEYRIEEKATGGSVSA